MMAYNLNGFSSGLGEKNEVCPNIQQNCCGKQDQDNIQRYFDRDRKTIEVYYKAVLLPFKYILGFGRQYEHSRRAIIKYFEDNEQ